jgi:hypothetical protein
VGFEDFFPSAHAHKPIMNDCRFSQSSTLWDGDAGLLLQTAVTSSARCCARFRFNSFLLNSGRKAWS